MKTSLSDRAIELRSLLQAEEQCYHNAVKNKMEFDKIKSIHLHIVELRETISKIKAGLKP